MSEQSLDQLIASLKTEAIEAAEKESESILADARKQAQQILQQAEDKKARTIEEAKQEAKDIRQKGETALRQAGRDYRISVRNELLQVFQNVLEAEVRKEFNPDLMKKAIGKLVENIGGELEVKLPEADKKELADYIHSRLKNSDTLLTISKDKSLLEGFSISKKEEGWSYSISPKEISEGLNQHLNGEWVHILSKEPEA